jgi:integrase
MRARYQRGNITLKERKGPHVWEFRWYDPNGTLRSKLLGTVEQYSTKQDAQRAADALRLEINSELPKAVPTTVATLIDRYLNDEVEMGRLAYATRRSYTTNLKNWVKPKWGTQFLEQVRTMGVELWLKDLPLAPKTKVHVRNVLHVLYECAIRWELIKDNPISRVRQGGARRADPEIMSVPEFHALLSEIKQGPYRVMVILAGCLGLSRSELTGLRWSDFNWHEATLRIERGIVNNHVGNTKTQARRKPVPLAPELIRILQEWRGQTPYSDNSDWVFASSYKSGVLPYWPDSVLKRIIQPAAKRAGLLKVVGWHTFRHSYSCLLRANHTDVKVQQELLRHSNIATTMNVYTQAVSEQKRAAHGQVVEQLLAI